MKKIVLWCLLTLTLTVVGALALPGLQPFWQQLGPEPKVVLDRAMQIQTIDTLVAKLNDHYVFPDTAQKIEAVLRQRQREGKYDGIRNGYKLAQQLTADVRNVAKDVHMKVWFGPGLDLFDEAEEPAPASLAEWEERNNVVMSIVWAATSAT